MVYFCPKHNNDLLAHAQLSGDNERVLAGNLMADAVKGRTWEKYAPDIQSGILLHRQIDDFTDKHPLVRQSKAVIREQYGLYSGVVTDIYFDHFLASDWETYSDTSLVNFSSHVYSILSRHFTLLPPRIKYILPYDVSELAEFLCFASRTETDFLRHGQTDRFPVGNENRRGSHGNTL